MSPRQTRSRAEQGGLRGRVADVRRALARARAQGRARLRPRGRRRHRHGRRRPGRRDRGDPRPRVPLDHREPALSVRLGPRDAGRVRRGAVRPCAAGACSSWTRPATPATTMRLAVNAIVNAGAAEVRTAVAFQTGAFEPDFHALATESTIVLPWDREVLFEGELVPNPLYRETLGADCARRDVPPRARHDDRCAASLELRRRGYGLVVRLSLAHPVVHRLHHLGAAEQEAAPLRAASSGTRPPSPPAARRPRGRRSRRTCPADRWQHGCSSPASGVASPQSGESSVATASCSVPTVSEPQPASRKNSAASRWNSSRGSDSGAPRAARRRASRGTPRTARRRPA